MASSMTCLNMLKRKSCIWFLCSLPLIGILGYSFFLSPQTYPFWSKSLYIGGYSAAILLAICLMLTPFTRVFSSIELFKILNRHKREIGLSCFFYAVIHVFSYFIKRSLKYGMLLWKTLLDPMVIPGEIAFFILFLMAITSNNYFVNKMQWKNWKNLHRFVYLAESFVFLHMFLQGDGVRLWAFVIFIPLVIFQFLRWQKR